MTAKEIIKIFTDECDYKKINDISTVKLRNCINGIPLTDVFYYSMMYTKKESTKEFIVSTINGQSKNSFTRQGFQGKEDNIPDKCYENIFNNIRNYYINNYTTNTGFKLFGIDGTYRNNQKMDEILNMGIHNITDGIPIDIKSYGKENKNKEISSITDYITVHLDKFEHSIIVGDRGYFSYDFMKFLIDNNLKFIIRAKGDGDNLNHTITLKKTAPNYNTIMYVRNNVRLIKYNNVMTKLINACGSKKRKRDHVVEFINNCNIVTNLPVNETYSDNNILTMYKSRWDIEVFFKYIKSVFKFQHTKEIDDKNVRKRLLCELSLVYLCKIIEKYYIGTNDMKNNKKINKTNLMNGIYSSLLMEIYNKKLTTRKLNKFCSDFIKIIDVKPDRHFPRTSKTPFTKWYVKGYSNQVKYMNIVDALLNDTVDKLNKNLKTIARKIKSIDGVNYN